MNNTGNAITPSEAQEDAHMASDRLRGEATFGPIVLDYDTPADGEGATDIMRLSVDPKLGKPGSNLEGLLCQGIAEILHTVEHDWTSLINLHASKP